MGIGGVRWGGWGGGVLLGVGVGVEVGVVLLGGGESLRYP